jgi:hypothetical protein
MDATSTSPVELPAISIDPVEEQRGATGSAELPTASQNRAINNKADPRSNLSVLRNDKGQPAYVNHWNQYKSMNGGSEAE